MTNALVVGGGIAGTVTAIALHKAGLDAEVHEAYDRTADGVGAPRTRRCGGPSCTWRCARRPSGVG